MSHAFELMDNTDYTETAKFGYMFDKFFDCLNTRNAEEGKRKRKPDLDPYRSDKDARFKVIFKILYISIIIHVYL